MLDANCQPMRAFNEKDSFAIRMARMNGYGLGVITGGSMMAVKQRLAVFGVPEEDIYMHTKDKPRAFDDFCTRHGYAPEEVAYLGDDIPDVALLRHCGWGVAPADAVQEAKDAADFVSDREGGKAFVRSVLESVMKAQGRWIFDVARYDAMF